MNDSKKMNKMIKLKIIENNEMKKSNEKTKYVIKDEIFEHEIMNEDERNNNNELKD